MGSETSWLIQGGHVVDPSQQIDGLCDVLVEAGTITRVEPNITAEAPTIDATGLYVIPGLIDVHVHFREPGREEAETIETGMRAAAAGGYTSVCVMPNTTPTIDTTGLVEYVLSESLKFSDHVHVHCIAAATRERAGKTLTDLSDLSAAGAVAFTDDGSPIADAALMRRALEYTRWLGKPMVSHAEDPALCKGGVMHEGVVSTTLGLRGIPAVAETVMVARDIELAAATGGHVHIAHASTAGTITLVREAKKRGVHVTCETAPHYLTLTHEAVRGYRTEAKMNPPLRTQADQDALIVGLQDGTIDLIATDHAPHPAWEKAVEFDHAPFGILGLETALGLLLTHFVMPGIISWTELVRLMSGHPAEVFGLPGGTLQAGHVADITVVDPQASWVVDVDGFASKSHNSPFHGWQLTGRVQRTFCGGRQVYHGQGAVA
jgi:dihydroorotase